MTISKGMFISQADMGLQAVNVLEKYKKHLEEEGASEERQVAVIKAIKYCQDCADASHIIMAALEWQAAQNGKPAEAAPKEAPKRKRAPRKKAAPKAEEKPKEEPAPTLFDAPLEKPAEAPKAEEVKEPPKEEPKPQETKANKPASDDSLDDLF